MITIDPYNVKVITYPDLTRQYRIYEKAVVYRGDHVYHKAEFSDNPFDDNKVRVITGDIDDHFDHILDVSVKRTRKNVYDYAKSNDWEYFVTFTFSDKKINRYDYELCSKSLSIWLNHLRRSSPALGYLVVPEQHKDGAWHFHGLFFGIHDSDLVDTGKVVIQKKRIEGRLRFYRTDQKIYQIGRYKLGWMTAIKLYDKIKVSSYITKYITKDMLKGLYGRKRYWSSRNLNKPVEDVFNLDATDRFILTNELAEVAKFHTVSSVSYGDLTQIVDIIEL